MAGRLEICKPENIFICKTPTHHSVFFLASYFQRLHNAKTTLINTPFCAFRLHVVGRQDISSAVTKPNLYYCILGCKSESSFLKTIPA